MIRLAPLGLFLCLGTPAFADAVPPPPQDCPPGAIGDTGHNGEWCRPTTCGTDADCPGTWADKRPRVCRPQPLCVETVTEPSQSGWSHGKPVTRDFARGGCGDGGKCDKGTCVEASRCVLKAEAVEPPKPPADTSQGGPATTSAPTQGGPATSQPTTKPSGGCGCAGGPESPLVVMAALALLARRRQRG